jgi:hypothetical protein
MKCAVEMDSGAMMYIPSFIKPGSGIENSTGGTQTHRGQDDLIHLIFSLISLFKKIPPNHFTGFDYVRCEHDAVERNHKLVIFNCLPLDKTSCTQEMG